MAPAGPAPGGRGRLELRRRCAGGTRRGRRGGARARPGLHGDRLLPAAHLFAAPRALPLRAELFAVRARGHPQPRDAGRRAARRRSAHALQRRRPAGRACRRGCSPPCAPRRRGIRTRRRRRGTGRRRAWPSSCRSPTRWRAMGIACAPPPSSRARRGRSSSPTGIPSAAGFPSSRGSPPPPPACVSRTRLPGAALASRRLHGARAVVQPFCVPSGSLE